MQTRKLIVVRSTPASEEWSTGETNFSANVWSLSWTIISNLLPGEIFKITSNVIKHENGRLWPRHVVPTCLSTSQKLAMSYLEWENIILVSKTIFWGWRDEIPASWERKEAWKAKMSVDDKRGPWMKFRVRNPKSSQNKLESLLCCSVVLAISVVTIWIVLAPSQDYC